MSDDFGQDELFDDELRAGLAALAPRPDDADAALAGIRPRARRTRSRRRARLVTATGACALMFVVGAAALVNDGNDRVQTVPANPGDGAPIPLDPTTTVASTPTTDPTTGSTPAGPTATTAPAPAPTTPGTTDDSVPGSGTTTPTSISSSPGPGGTTAPTTYNSRGGSITVRLANGNLELLSVTPASGYAEQNREVDADRIRVDFESDEGDHTRIEVEEENGELQPKIDE